MKIFTPVAIATAALLISGCGSTSMMSSAPVDREIIVDGDASEWSGVLQPIEKQRFSLGITDDLEFLNIVLSSRDNGTNLRIIRDGLILWIDGSGEEKKTFGIKFPIGIAQFNAVGARPRNGSLGGNRSSPQMDERMQRAFEMSVGFVELFTDDGEWVHHHTSELPHIRVRAKYELGSLTYEIRIPMQESDEINYAVNPVVPTIAIGIETPEPDLEQFRGQGAGRGGAGGGIPGVGGSRGGGGGSGRRAGQGSAVAGLDRSSESIDFWSLVALSSAE